MFSLRKIDGNLTRNEQVCILKEKDAQLFCSPDDTPFASNDYRYQIYPADITTRHLPLGDNVVCCIFLETTSKRIIHVYHLTQNHKLYPVFQVTDDTCRVWLCLGDKVTDCKDVVATATTCESMIDKCTY